MRAVGGRWGWGLHLLTCLSSEPGAAGAAAGRSRHGAGCEVHGPALPEAATKVWAGHRAERAGAPWTLCPKRPCACTGVLARVGAASGRCPCTAAAARARGRADPAPWPAPPALLLKRHCGPQSSALRCAPCSCRKCRCELPLLGPGPSAKPRPLPCHHSPSPPRVPPAPQLRLRGRCWMSVPSGHVSVCVASGPTWGVFDLQTSACQILHGHTGEGTNQALGPYLDGVPGLASADL